MSSHDLTVLYSGPIVSIIIPSSINVTQEAITNSVGFTVLYFTFFNNDCHNKLIFNFGSNRFFNTLCNFTIILDINSLLGHLHVYHIFKCVCLLCSVKDTNNTLLTYWRLLTRLTVTWFRVVSWKPTNNIPIISNMTPSEMRSRSTIRSSVTKENFYVTTTRAVSTIIIVVFCRARENEVFFNRPLFQIVDIPSEYCSLSNICLTIVEANLHEIF